MALVFKNTLNIFPQRHLPPKGEPERGHNCSSCCTTQEKIVKCPAGGEDVHCFSTICNCFSNTQERACCSLCFNILASKILLKVFNFLSVQRKLSDEMHVRVCPSNMGRKCMCFSSVSSLHLHKCNQLLPDRIFNRKWERVPFE